MTVQMKDRAWRQTAQYVLHDHGVLPGSGGQACHALKQIVVVGGGNRQSKVAQCLQLVSVRGLELSCRVGEPAAKLAVAGHIERGADLARDIEKRLDLRARMEALEQPVCPRLVLAAKANAMIDAIAQQPVPRGERRLRGAGGCSHGNAGPDHQEATPIALGQLSLDVAQRGVTDAAIRHGNVCLSVSVQSDVLQVYRKLRGAPD